MMNHQSGLLFLLLLPAVCLAGTSRPELSIGLSTKTNEIPTINDIVPGLKWTASGSVADTGIDWDGGVSLKYDAGAATMPYTCWGRAKRSVFGFFNAACRLDTTSKDLNQFDVDLTLTGDADAGVLQNTGLQFKGAANVDSRKASLASVQLSQQVPDVVGGGTLTIIPRYNFAARQGDIRLAYGMSGAGITLDATTQKATLAVTKELGDKNRIVPSVSTTGEVQLEYSRSVTDTSSVTATVKPNSFVNLQFKETSLGVAANLNAPMRGFGFSEAAKFSISRTGIF